MGSDTIARRAWLGRRGGQRRGVAALAVALPLVFMYAFRITYNSTDSLPVGIYRIRELRGAPARGDVVGFCLEGEIARLAMTRGYVHREGLERFWFRTRCASGVAVIAKPVAAVPGDTVEVQRGGVWINGAPLANSRVLERDRAGRELPHARWGRRVLGSDEYWVQSTYSQSSFDSRYYGPVRRRQFVDGPTPLLVK